MSSEERRGKIDHDNPPFSRLFVVCSKNHDDEDIKESFGKYGTVSQIKVQPFQSCFIIHYTHNRDI